MTRRIYLYAILLLAAIVALAAVVWPKGPAPLTARVTAAAAPVDVSGFARAEGPREIVFPADRGPHNDYQTEWWYYTGNLTAETGEHFGFQLTFFRRALVPPAQRADRASAWGTDQVYMAHFALTDVRGGRHYSFERLARGAAGIAGAQAEPYRVWLEDWEVAEVGPDVMADAAIAAAVVAWGRGLKSTSDEAKSAEADWGVGAVVAAASGRGLKSTFDGAKSAEADWRVGAAEAAGRGLKSTSDGAKAAGRGLKSTSDGAKSAEADWGVGAVVAAGRGLKSTSDEAKSAEADWGVDAAEAAASGRGLKSTFDGAKSAEADWGVGNPARLRAAALDPNLNLNLSLDLLLSDLKPPVLQGERGYSRKGPEPGNASYYVSRTRIAAQGTVTVGDKTYVVSGLSWMDQEWSTSALGPEQVGWDWFSIQLDDGSELMAFQLRRADGSVDAFSSGTLIAADGATRTLGPDDFTITPTATWRSPRSGGVYPAGWILTVPAADLRLEITPWLADQEMQVSYIYWEGAVRAAGTSAGRPVTGNGYVELTGYAGSMQGEF